MAEAVADSRRTVVQRGLIAKSLTAMAKVIQWLLLSLVFSILVEWIGMLLWWPEEGLDHSRHMVRSFSRRALCGTVVLAEVRGVTFPGLFIRCTGRRHDLFRHGAHTAREPRRTQ